MLKLNHEAVNLKFLWCFYYCRMGRTFRKRRRRKSQVIETTVSDDIHVIVLRQFMKNGLWEDELKLKLRNFPVTGRGVYSPKTIEENQVLIKVPYELMITYESIDLQGNVLRPNSKLKMHDLLALFLVIEKLKKVKSIWWGYIQSLPLISPELFWTSLSLNHLKALPHDLEILGIKCRQDFEESWNRVNIAIATKYRDYIDYDLYLWGYIMVNTRSVYVDPEQVNKTNSSELLDEPSMALCPFLDMFNHSHEAKTDASISREDDHVHYQLITRTPTKKYEEIFISYGNHDNLKLMAEYGFFIPGNSLDRVEFNEKEVIKTLDLKIDKFRYDFIRKHKFDDASGLYISSDGSFSFNLKAFLYVALNKNVRDSSSVIFSDSYDDESRTKMLISQRILLKFKLKNHEKEIEECAKIWDDGLVMAFLKYRISFIKKLSLMNKCDHY